VKAILRGLILASIALVSLSGAQSLDSALAYYPFQPGNFWQYDYSTGTQPPSHYAYYTVTIGSDTVMANQKVYRPAVRTRALPWFPSVQYFRLDSAQAAIFQFSTGTQTETLWDSLPAGVAFADTVLGQHIQSRWRISTGAYGYTLSMGLGMTRCLIDEDPTFGSVIGSLSSLVYARIGSTEYGTLMTIAPEAGNQHEAFALYQNYPNPFNPTTTVTYLLPRTENVTLALFDLLGREVLIIESGLRSAGLHSVAVNGSNLASGVYFCRLIAGQLTSTRKLVVAK
jgi:hypothetical protein